MAKRTARKGDGVCQTADGRWIATVDDGRNPDQTRKRIRKRFDSEREARAWKHEQETAKRHGRLPGAGRLTVADYAEEWLSVAVPARGVKERAILDYRDYIDRYLLPSVGTVKLGDLTAVHLDRVYHGLLTVGRIDRPRTARGGATKPRPLSARTVRHLHTIVRDMLETARKKRLLMANPAVDAEIPKVSGQTRDRFKVWSGAECRRFLDRADLDPYQALWYLLLTTGMRIGEARGLTWPDLDLKRGKLRVAATVSLDRNRADKRTAPKTGHGDRVLKVPPESLSPLKDHRRACLESRFQGKAAGDVDYVFRSESGGPADPSTLQAHFVRLIKAAGVPRIRIHDCRHTYASLALAAGVPITEVSATLGHANTGITMALYAHFVPGNEDRAAEAVATAIFGAK